MSSLGIFGPQGSGKSLFAMVLARMLQRLDSDLDIYTNMNVEGHNIKTINDLALIPLEDGRRKVFILDEAYFSLDSRNTSSQQNRIWSKAFALFRKSDLVLNIFITHRPRMIDVNIREQLNYILMCRKNPGQFEYLLLEPITELTCPIVMPKSKQIYDFANYDTKDFPLPVTVDNLKNLPLFQILK